MTSSRRENLYISTAEPVQRQPTPPVSSEVAMQRTITPETPARRMGTPGRLRPQSRCQTPGNQGPDSKESTPQKPKAIPTTVNSRNKINVHDQSTHASLEIKEEKESFYVNRNRNCKCASAQSCKHARREVRKHASTHARAQANTHRST